jgi:hypothetical protein
VFFAWLGKAQVILALLSPFAKITYRFLSQQYSSKLDIALIPNKIRPLSRFLKPYHPLKKRNRMVK